MTEGEMQTEKGNYGKFLEGGAENKEGGGKSMWEEGGSEGE